MIIKDKGTDLMYSSNVYANARPHIIPMLHGNGNGNRNKKRHSQKLGNGIKIIIFKKQFEIIFHMTILILYNT